MTKALKIAMTAYGAIGTLFGLSYLLFPRQLSELQDADEVSTFLIAMEMTLGASVVAAGVFVAIAARDPIRNILWVRFAIVFALSFLTVAVYSGMVLFDEFNQALAGVILHGVFAALLLVLYPRGVVRNGEQMAPLERAHP